MWKKLSESKKRLIKNDMKKRKKYDKMMDELDNRSDDSEDEDEDTKDTKETKDKKERLVKQRPRLRKHKQIKIIVKHAIAESAIIVKKQKK